VTSLTRHWPLAALLASAAMLAIAHGFETFSHLAPCTLCLRQREVYWAAIGVAAAGVALSFTPFKARQMICLALTIVFLYGAGVAAYHAGAEWKFWPGPKSCSGGATSISTADISALLKGAGRAPPVCDKPAWVFLGLSMAGWNALVSLGLAILSARAARTPEP
jgi:disulfide bond formation protein DsbB